MAIPISTVRVVYDEA